MISGISQRVYNKSLLMWPCHRFPARYNPQSDPLRCLPHTGPVWLVAHARNTFHLFTTRAPPPKVYPASTNRDGKKYLHVVARILFLVFHLNWSAWFLQLCFAKNFPQLCSGTDTGTFSGPPRKRLASMLCSGTRWLAAGSSSVLVMLEERSHMTSPIFRDFLHPSFLGLKIHWSPH